MGGCDVPPVMLGDEENMRRRCLIGAAWLLGCVLVIGCNSKTETKQSLEEAVNEEQNRLDGKWGGSSSLSDGQQAGSDFQTVFFDFKGDSVVIQEMMIGKKTDAKVKLDPQQSPKTMDIVMEKVTLQAIYKLEGDQLTLCYSMEKD
jgi:uncharacterized protein (TIGR03067 family)